MDPAAELLFSQQCEPSFHQIQPTGRSGRAMRMKARPLRQPVANPSGFVRSVVIQNQTHIQLWRPILFNGSLESLKVPARCGASEKARRMRLMLDGLSPRVLAISRVDQCMAVSGWLSSVRAKTNSTCLSLSLREVPGRGSSSRPPHPAARKRRRHLPTACAVVESRYSMKRFLRLSAANRTMRTAWPKPARSWAVGSSIPVPRAAERRNIFRAPPIPPLAQRNKAQTLRLRSEG